MVMAESEIDIIERSRKRHFAYFCIAICLPIVGTFLIVDIIEGQSLEILSNILMLVVLSLGFIFIKELEADLLVYRIGLILMAAVFLYNIVIGSGEGTAVFWIFPFPLVFLYLLGRKEGGIYTIVFFCFLTVFLFNPLSLDIYSYELDISFRFLISLFLVTLMAFGLETSRERYGQMLHRKNIRLKEEMQHLEKAMSEIKTLSGLIPICCNCKNVRNDDGYWEQVETYVMKRSSADFSHGICPDCIEKIYPQLKNTKRKP